MVLPTFASVCRLWRPNDAKLRQDLPALVQYFNNISIETHYPKPLAFFGIRPSKNVDYAKVHYVSSRFVAEPIDKLVSAP